VGSEINLMFLDCGMLVTCVVHVDGLAS
jgi:hypothetical protein